MEQRPQCGRAGEPARGLASYLAVDVATDGTRSQVRLVDDVDLSSRAKLQAALQDARRNGPALVELDLGELSFLCVSALGVLIEAHTALHDAGGRLILLNPGRLAQRVLQLANLDDVLDVRTTARRTTEHSAGTTGRSSRDPRGARAGRRPQPRASVGGAM